MKVPAVTNDPFRIELPSRWLGHLFNRVPVTPDMIVNHLARNQPGFKPLELNTF